MKTPGDRVDRYVIEALLGRGGMGEVYEATDSRLGRRVALKLILPGADADANQRMLREARAAASFEHAHAVVVYDVGEAEGATYLAMELVRGTSLRALAGDAGVSVGRRLRWLVDVARALGAAHRQGIVHRDVKPDNVMIREDGAAKVLDFGIARRQAGAAVDPSAPTQASSTPLETLTAAGVIVGTPQYAAPEQLRGEPVDGRTDEFAWGVMAYELLCGALPWRGPDSMTLLAQILSADPPPLAEQAPALPAPVAAAVTRALAKRAADRFATIDEAADALEPFAEASAVATPGRGATAIAATATPPRRTVLGRVVRGTGRVVFVIFAVIGGLIVVGVGSAFFAAWRTGALYVNPKHGGAGDADGGPCTVAALSCADARIEGEGATPELGQAIGRAACARVATQLGVDWGGGGEGAPLGVDVALGAGEARVTLTALGHRGEGKGPTPLDAIVAAQASLTKELAAPPMGEAEVKSWGAADEAGARRVERVWRELLLGVLRNDEDAVKALVVSDPRSAWSHLLVALVRPRLTAEWNATVARGLELVDALPPARAHALRGTFMILGLPGTEAGKEALGLLRRAYTEAPDDGDVVGLYAAVAIAMGFPEEGYPVLDRLSTRFPTKSVLALRNAVGRGLDHDLERDGRYVARMRAILPESFAWEQSVRYLGNAGRFEDARAALAFGRRLGMSGMSVDPAMLDLSQAWVELAAGEPRAARDLAARVLGDPRHSVSSAGTEYTIASYLMEGRVVDAEAAELHELERQRAVGTPAVVAVGAFCLARIRRLLGRPPPGAETLAAMDTFVASYKDDDAVTGRFVAETALARAALDPRARKALLGDALEKLRAQADKAPDRLTHDGILILTLPLARALEGDAAATRVWLETDRAPFRARRSAAFEAALALESAGRRAEAAAAYALAMDPFDIESHVLAAGIARARLAALRRVEGRKDEAEKLEAVVDRLWLKADPGLREAVKKMR